MGPRGGVRLGRGMEMIIHGGRTNRNIIKGRKWAGGQDLRKRERGPKKGWGKDKKKKRKKKKRGRY